MNPSRPSFQACLATHSACYPNGGAQLAGSAAALLAYLRSMLGALKATSKLPRAAERGYDQAALHRLYLNRSRGVQLRVDSDAEFVLQLWACAADGPALKRRGNAENSFEYCSERRHAA